MNVLAITQARMGSTRFPGKILEKVQDKSLLQVHVERIKQAKTIDQLLIATTVHEHDALLVTFAEEMNCLSYAGSEADVLDRFYQGALQYRPQWCVRLTSDCPLVDPALIDAIVSHALDNDLDYCSNTLVEHFPDGQDIEVFKFAALEKAWCEAELGSEREHVTPYLKKHSSFMGEDLFASANYPCKADFNHVRHCVDEVMDLEVIRKLVEIDGFEADWETYTTTYLEHADIRKLNADVVRNEGYLKSLKSDDE